MSDLFGKDDIGPQYSELLSTQQYTRSPRISGVEIIDLRAFHDDGGSFLELARLGEDAEVAGVPGFRVKQCSFTIMMPGTIKAFHLHFRQEDLWFVSPSDRMLMGLIDTRVKSPTYKTTMRFMLGCGKTQLLLIPRGVAHGAANMGTAPGSIIYFVNQQFNAEDPDERRLPFDICGEDFWTSTPG
jgi:dTDP-4-dehydrorhamnose 3,5-epimerase